MKRRGAVHCVWLVSRNHALTHRGLDPQRDGGSDGAAVSPFLCVQNKVSNPSVGQADAKSGLARVHNLFAQDVAVSGVAGVVFDHVEVDPPDADGASGAMRGVGETGGGADGAGSVDGAFELGDRIGPGFGVGDVEAAVAGGGVSVALGFVEASEEPLEPESFGRGCVFDQCDRCGE